MRLSAALFPILLAAAAPAAADCPVAPLQQAAAAHDLAAVGQARQAMLAAGPSCSPAEQAWAGDLTALLYLQTAEQRRDAGAPPRQVLALVDQGLAAGRPWPLLQLRGWLLTQIRDGQEGPDWIAASRAYQDALNDIHDRATPPRASEEEAKTLWRLAEQTRLLATGIVTSPLARGGAPGGLELARLRGDIDIQPVAQPIHFVFEKADFTGPGREAAEALAEMLRREGNPPILLIGHCDYKGSDEFNLLLSRQRAEAVKNFLIARGYPAGRIATEGHGRREPLLRLIEGISDDDYRQILRRVVLVRR